MSYPNARDCEHGRQRGKCPECEVMELKAENAQLKQHVQEFVTDANKQTKEIVRLNVIIERAKQAVNLKQYLTKDGKPFPCENCRSNYNRDCLASDEQKSKFPLSSFACFLPKQPPRPEELRFTVKEVMDYVKPFLRDYEGTRHEDLCRMIEKAFTERRRNEGKM